MDLLEQIETFQSFFLVSLCGQIINGQKWQYLLNLTSVHSIQLANLYLSSNISLAFLRLIHNYLFRKVLIQSIFGNILNETKHWLLMAIFICNYLAKYFQIIFNHENKIDHCK